MNVHVTVIKSLNPEASCRPVVCFLPGGPGLSSATLRSMDVLARSFDLAYVDPPGTGSAEQAPENMTYIGIISAIEEKLYSQFRDRSILFSGHSFGGLMAISIAHRANIKISGLIFLATPISKESYQFACGQYEANLTPSLEIASKAWEDQPNDLTFSRWLGSYGRLYFTEKSLIKGKKMLLSDRVSATIFMQISSVLTTERPVPDFVTMLQSFVGKKLLVAGADDLLVLSKCLQSDANDSGCDYRLVPGVGHFLTFDDPEAVAGIVEEFVIDRKTKVT